MTLTLRTIRGEIKPVMSLYDCRMSDLFPTSREPGRALRRQDAGLRGQGRRALGLARPLLRAGRRARARHPRAGRHRQRQGARATRSPASSARRCAAKRGTWAPPYLGLDEAIDAAYAEPEGPVVVADPTDNAGGGAASDNTNIIRRLIERGLSDAAVGPMWDPVAVQFCHAAGVGTTLPLRFGGKTALTSGAPVDAEVDDHRPQARRAPNLRHRQGAVRRRAPASASAASRSR